MDRDIGASGDQPVALGPGHRPGSRRWLRQSLRSGSIRWVERTSPVSRATTVTATWSTMARTRRRAWAAPILRVVEASGPAQGDRARLVGDVEAGAEVAPGAGACGQTPGPPP